MREEGMYMTMRREKDLDGMILFLIVDGVVLCIN